MEESDGRGILVHKARIEVLSVTETRGGLSYDLSPRNRGQNAEARRTDAVDQRTTVFRSGDGRSYHSGSDECSMPRLKNRHSANIETKSSVPGVDDPYISTDPRHLFDEGWYENAGRPRTRMSKTFGLVGARPGGRHLSDTYTN